jgi:hypothetical protein
MSDQRYGDNVKVVEITCEYQQLAGGGYAPALFYDGLPDQGLSINVPLGCDRLVFRRDDSADNVPFFFTGANISPEWTANKVYGDLKLATVTDNAVTVFDRHEHTDQMVGGVTLFYFINSVANRSDRPAGAFVSDPEIINTGRD